MTIGPSELLSSLPPYPFAELERRAEMLRSNGVEIIDLSVGDPDLPPPEEVLRALSVAALDPRQHRYSSSRGEGFLREAVSRWYHVRFGVKVDPSSEVCITWGSKDGLANVLRAIADPGDKVLVPDPGYPVYGTGAARLARCRPVELVLERARGFLPDLSSMGGCGAKLMFLNYPNNPTGATATREFLKEVVDFAMDEGCIICYDNAYSELSFAGIQPSILQIPDALECAVEVHSLSKTFSMPGDRIGFMVGNRTVIESLVKLKSQVDSGCPVYIQSAAACALSMYESPNPPSPVENNIRSYRERMERAVKGLSELGFPCQPAKATFYLWLDLGKDTSRFVDDLLRAGVLVTPGKAFGRSGSSFIRLALTRPAVDIQRAVARIGICMQRANLGQEHANPGDV